MLVLTEAVLLVVGVRRGRVRLLGELLMLALVLVPLLMPGGVVVVRELRTRASASKVLPKLSVLHRRAVLGLVEVLGCVLNTPVALDDWRAVATGRWPW